MSDVKVSRRLSRDDRRDALLDVAALLLVEGGSGAVTMDAVAASAGVSRPLVYKHFANREEVMVGLYRRETASLDDEVSEALRGIRGVEVAVRTSVEAVLDGVARRGRAYSALLREEALDAHLRREQRDRHRRNRRWYTRLIVDEFGIDEADADAAVAVYFSGLDAMLAARRSSPNGPERQHLVDIYVRLVMGGLRALAPAVSQPA